MISLRHSIALLGLASLVAIGAPSATSQQDVEEKGPIPRTTPHEDDTLRHDDADQHSERSLHADDNNMSRDDVTDHDRDDGGETKLHKDKKDMKKSDKPMPTGKQFVRKAADGNMFEVQFGKLGAQRAHSDEVREFAQMLADEHARLNEKTGALARSKGVDLPPELPQEKITRLNELEGMLSTQFDRKYIAEAIKDHKHDIAMYEHEIANGNDEEIKAAAREGLPYLKKHLERAQAIKSKMGEDKLSSGDSHPSPKPEPGGYDAPQVSQGEPQYMRPRSRIAQHSGVIEIPND